MNSSQKNNSPTKWIKDWLPHLFILFLLGASVYFLYQVLKPILPAILMAGGICSITMPILYSPIYKRVRSIFQQQSDALQRKIAAGLTLCFIGLLFLIPFLILIISITGSLSSAEEILFSLAEKNILYIEAITQKIVSQINEYKELYPSIPIDPSWLSLYIKRTLSDLFDFQSTIMGFLFKGTGNFAAQIVLTVIAMFFFYSEGHRIIHMILKATPINEENSQQLIKTFNRVVLRLLSDTIALSVIQGMTLGFLVGWFTNFNIIVLMMISSFICLIPLLGSTMIWFPACLLLSNQGHTGKAILLALLCIGALAGIMWLRKSKMKPIHDYSPTLSFLLFMSLIGGIISFGFKGLLLGPMAVILVNVLGQFWHAHYKNDLPS